MKLYYGINSNLLDIVNINEDYHDIEVLLPKLKKDNVDDQKDAIVKSMGMDEENKKYTLGGMRPVDALRHTYETTCLTNLVDPIKNLSRLTEGFKTYFEQFDIPVKIRYSFFDTCIDITNKYTIKIRPLKSNKVDIILCYSAFNTPKCFEITRTNKNYTFILNTIINIIRKIEYDTMTRNKRYMEKLANYNTDEYNFSDKDIEKMNYYYNKDSDPYRMARSIKTIDKLYKRLIVASMMNWDGAIDAFSRELRHEYYEKSEKVDAYIYKGQQMIN